MKFHTLDSHAGAHIDHNRYVNMDNQKIDGIILILSRYE